MTESVCMWVWLCLFLASDSLETITIQVIVIIKLGTVTASCVNYIDCVSVTFIQQGHTDLNHGNNKCSIISENVQAVPVKFAVKIVQLKVYYVFFSLRLMSLTFI